jgi:hypothetical protein
MKKVYNIGSDDNIKKLFLHGDYTKLKCLCPESIHSLVYICE